jgi:hypothetical protein
VDTSGGHGSAPHPIRCVGGSPGLDEAHLRGGEGTLAASGTLTIRLPSRTMEVATCDRS